MKLKYVILCGTETKAGNREYNQLITVLYNVVSCFSYFSRNRLKNV